MEAKTRAALFNALAWIDGMKGRAGVDTENVEVGVQCLSEAFNVGVHDADQRRALAVNSAASFEDIFAAGLQALGLELGEAASTEPSVDDDPVVSKNPELWNKWVAKLEDKGFFNGAPAGSQEHANRTKKALAKFKEKFSDVKPATPVMSKEEKESKAEELKAQGNAALNGQDYTRAAQLYREALKLSPSGPNSHIYHSNLAAALMYLHEYTEVIDHCEQSIALKTTYVKAYSRMGGAQVHLKDYQGAIDSFHRGLEVDSSNAACRDGLADAEHKLRQQQSVAASGASSAGASGAGGMPDLSGLASMLGGGGGGGGLADLMSNPALQQMASSMMQNPAMMQMAQNMMQNPDMMRNMMGGLGGMGGGAPPAGAAAGAGAGAGGGGGMPDPSQLMNSPEMMAARSDPELQDFFRDMDAEGPSAAMRHMSNPKVSQLMQNLMSRMQG